MIIMCWITCYKGCSECHTAKKNIKVFKIVKTVNSPINSLNHSVLYDIVPYFMSDSNIIYGSIMTKGKRVKYIHGTAPMTTYLDDSVPMIKSGYVVNHGFHSYDRRRIHIKKLYQGKYFSTIGVYYRKNLLHMKSPCIHHYHKDSTLKFGYMIMKCIIPKGAKYYLNEQGEYVSDSIKITGFKKLRIKIIRICVGKQ